MDEYCREAIANRPVEPGPATLRDGEFYQWRLRNTKASWKLGRAKDLGLGLWRLAPMYAGEEHGSILSDDEIEIQHIPDFMRKRRNGNEPEQRHEQTGQCAVS